MPKPVASLTTLRFHANRAETPAAAAPDPERPVSTERLKTTEDEARSLEESAGKATQQHSGPEGAQQQAAHEAAAHEAALKDVSKTTEVTEKEQSRKDWEIIRKLLPNLWPKDDWGTKTRVMLALGLLIGGKVRMDGSTPAFRVADFVSPATDPQCSSPFFLQRHNRCAQRND